MLAHKELQKVYQNLLSQNYAQLFINGSDITLTIFDDSSKISLTTPVYFGGNYIPNSVRVAIKKHPPFEKYQSIKTSLTINEDDFRIFLNYLDTTEALNNEKFTHLLEDFCHIAEEWRIYLEEHDKEDLIYINNR